MSQQFTKSQPLDTDGTLAANSDYFAASQKAVKTYADTKLAAVTADAPLSGSGTAGSHLVIAAASASVPGSMSAADFTKVSHIGVCSFFASNSASNLLNVTGDNTKYPIVFDAEKYDLGTDYNTTDGKFTAPYTGTYLFIANVVFQQVNIAVHSETDVELMVEGAVATAYTYTAADTRILSGITTYSMSHSALVRMTAGDTCKVKAVVYGSSRVCDIYGSATNILTTFSGTFIG